MEKFFFVVQINHCLIEFPYHGFCVHVVLHKVFVP